ncbi:MAG: energy-coupling factor ABC transporter ATP-binding protein [Candidatus Bipolaricaulia bacterium]
MAILRADNLRFGYEKGREVLHGIDLEVNRGEDFCLLGPSGAGKTTLLRLLNLLCKPTSGEIRFNFKAESPARDGELELRRRMAMVFQEPALFDTTVWGNVAYGLLSRMGLMTRVKERWAGLLNGRSDLDRRVREVLEAVGLAGFERRPAPSLSVGERRRVALARALVVEPELLLLDEPTANLDPRNTALIESLIERSNRAGTTIVLATHDMNQARRLGDRVALLLDGRIIEEGPVERIFQAPEDGRTRAFIRGELVC